MVCRNQLRIAVRLATVALLVGAFAAGYAILSAESFLKRRVVAAIEASVPHWDVSIADVRLDGAQARVFGLKVKPAGSTDPIVEVPELIVSLNPAALAEGQSIVPECIQIREPSIHLVRRADGTLNIDDLKPWPKSSSGGSPLTEIQRASVSVEQAGQIAQVRDLDILLTPESRGNYQARGSGRLDDFGEVAVVGTIGIPQNRFDLKLKGRLHVDDRLVQTAAAWHPTAGQKIAEWSRGGVKLASASIEDAPNGIAGPATLGLTADTDVLVSLKKEANGPLQWAVESEVVRGELNNPLFPLPLRNLTGRVTVTSEGLQVEELSAANGLSGFHVSGNAKALPNGGLQKVFQVTAENVSLDGPLRRFLTPALARAHELLNPHGLVDLEARIDESGKRVTQWNLVSLTVRDGSFSCQQFPYLVRQVDGKAWQEGADIKLKFSGKAGSRDVDISGRVIDAGPGAGFDIVVSSGGLPIDSQLKEAFNTKALRKVKEVAEALHLNGVVDGIVRVIRPPHAPPGTRPLYEVDVALSKTSLSYDRFPYRLEGASGTIKFYETEDGIWQFKNIVANRGSARISAGGTFHPPTRRPVHPAIGTSTVSMTASAKDAPGMLDMTVQALGVPIDREIVHAITTAAPDLGPVFKELNPTGEISATDVNFKWMPGRDPDIALPKVRVSDGTLQVRSFPYLWTDLDTTLRLDGKRRVIIEELSAKHQDAVLTLRPDRSKQIGKNRPSVSFAEALDEGWQARLYGLEVKRLLLDKELELALPDQAAQALRVLNVARPIDIAGDIIVADTPKHPNTIAARGVIDLPGNDATTGVDLKGVRGQIHFDPVVIEKNNLTIDGQIEIQQMRAFDMAMSDVRGPIRYRNGRLLIGSADMVNEPPDDPTEIREEDRVTANFYGGGIGIDVDARLVSEGVFSYDIAGTMADADLNLWAADNGLAQADLHGKMNGAVRVSGLSNDIRSLRGTDGFLAISQARLLRLPAFVQMMSVLNLRPPDNTFFRHVYLNFDVRDGMFDFKQVNLYGTNLSFVGNGQAYFRPEDYGEIDFNMASYVPPNNPNPLSRIWASLGSGWIYVRLGGSIGNPVTTLQTRLALFDGFSNVMKSIERGQFVLPRARAPRLPR